MLRFGLCCLFKNEPIRFRRTTAKYTASLPVRERKKHLSDICLHNAGALLEALRFCYAHGIGAFRINSRILPLITHPETGYRIEDLPGGEDIAAGFKRCGDYSRRRGLRTSFHPDQFIVLSSPDRSVVKRSEKELAYQAQAAAWVGADVINLHGGGFYGDKKETLKRLARRIARLPDTVRSRLTLENDDRVYTPRDLLPVCSDAGVPLVYDVHHHRCQADGLTVEEATALALQTWNREPHFRISSPLQGWGGKNPRPHHDYVDPCDFPHCWLNLDITVDVEGKAKECAVLQLMRQLE